MNWPRVWFPRWRVGLLEAAMGVWICLIGMICLLGCTTVTVPLVVPTAPSMDGNARNSGFWGYDAQGYGIISTNAAARYNGLMASYGGRWAPAVRPGDGLSAGPSNGVVRIDKEHLDAFKQANFWRNNGK